MQKRLLQVAKARRTVYLTAGHGERTKDPLAASDQRPTIESSIKTLQDQNFEVRTLSTAEGLGQEVPKDAAAVFIVGPSGRSPRPRPTRWPPTRSAAGDSSSRSTPKPKERFEELLKPLGLKLTPDRLAQERGIATVRPPPSLADRVNIATRTFSSHPSVTYAGPGERDALVLGRRGPRGALAAPAELAIDFAVRSLNEAWNDANENFQFDQAAKEAKKAWGLVAAVTRRASPAKADEELRVLVLGDSDGLGDELLPQLPANAALVQDGLKWLLGEEQLAGVTNTEVDVAPFRSRQQDTVWFYGTTFFAPVLVLGVGALARRRNKRADSTPKKAEVQS